jgi:hypothetical protein
MMSARARIEGLRSQQRDGIARSESCRRARILLLEVGVAPRDRGAVEFHLDHELIDNGIAEHP